MAGLSIILVAMPSLQKTRMVDLPDRRGLLGQLEVLVPRVLLVGLEKHVRRVRLAVYRGLS